MRVEGIAFAALLCLGAPATAQQGAGADQPEPQIESGIASGGGTGFLQADGFAALPDAAPVPADRPLDPEDRLDIDLVDADEETAPGLPGGDDAPTPTVREREVVVIRPEAPTASDGATDDVAPVYVRLRESDEEFAACTAALKELGASFEPAEPVTTASDSDCGIARPLLVSKIAPGIALQPDALMRCDTATALAQWVHDDVLPAVKNLPSRSGLSVIDHGSTYICRRRNNRPTGKLSEHAFGNAVDVMGFRFERGEPLRIEPREPSGPAAAFQRTVRKASCDHFTTVIGPGTNAAHADHLHLDVKERRGGYRLCE